MKTIERLYKYLEYRGIKPGTFEKQIGLSQGYLGKMHGRRADMGEGIILQVIENCPEIDLLWLLTGNGSMLRDEQPAPRPIPPTEPPDADCGATIYKEWLAEQKRDMADLKAECKQEIAVRDEKINQLNREIGAMGEKLSARTQTAPSAFLGTAHPGIPVLFDPAGPPDDGPLASDVTPATKPTRGQTVVRN